MIPQSRNIPQAPDGPKDKMKKHKVYSIEFNQYTNCMRDTVWCEEEDKYLDVGKGTFLILEEDIDKYRKFGGGIKSLIYVGDIFL